MRDDFSLPHKSDGHYAHSNHADNQKERLLCFRSGNAKAASNPIHGKGSPSTRPLRCGPYAIVAGERDVAPRRDVAQVKGQTVAYPTFQYYLRESIVCGLKFCRGPLLPLITLCKTIDSPIHFFRCGSPLPADRFDNSLPHVLGIERNLSKSRWQPLFLGIQSIRRSLAAHQHKPSIADAQ